jgi:hypothetical protein
LGDKSDTLLGPEGTIRTTPVGLGWVGLLVPGMISGHTVEGLSLVGGFSAGVLVGVVGWLLVEMCIVDASIFVVKLSRADGGCLGTGSR